MGRPKSADRKHTYSNGANKRDKAGKKPGQTDYRKYSMDMPEIDAYAKFKATPLTLREHVYGEGIRSERDYMLKIGVASGIVPEGWFNAPKFWDVVEKYEKSFRAENIVRAKNALQQRIAGMKITKTRIKKNAMGQIVETETTQDTLAPDVSAAATMLKACGALQENVNITGNLTMAALMTRAAEMRGKKE